MLDDALLAEATFSCEFVQRVQVRGAWMPVAHRAASDKLYAVTDGGGWLTIDRHRYRLRSGRVYLIPAGSVHAGDPSERRPLRKLYIHFHATFAGSLPLLRLASPPACVSGKTADLVLRLAEEMEHEWEAKRDARSLALNTLLAQAMLALYRSPKRDRRRRDAEAKALPLADASDEQYDVVRSVLARIARDYDQPLSLPELASAVHWTPGHLSRVFHRLTGQPPRRFIESVRLRHARQRLASNDASVADVARSVGFDDANYFSRVFQRQLGLSPSQYREHQTGGRPDASA